MPRWLGPVKVLAEMRRDRPETASTQKRGNPIASGCEQDRGGKQSKSKRQKATRGHVITRHVTPKGALVRKVVRAAAIEVEVVFLQATCIYLNISITQANYRVIDCNKRRVHYY
jgi:hypothetical protein